ncbi:(2Fe-2S) ferredoxin domain-containing protein [Candidatus Clostridium radicumherbarum]|uniref:(2Fe-2S) ferredoxin domain-containing protein n=1 Tax=Candidatus Clostridium radicumherbarum TaxID=3381662 RepID=A0ABW8TSB8_9CLOT
MTITVCIGSSCHLKGSYDIVHMLQKLISEHNLENKVEIKASFCLGDCKNGVCVKVDESPIISVKKENVNDFFNDYIVKSI